MQDPPSTKALDSAAILIAPNCRKTLQALIGEYRGCEVFAIGTCGESGAVEELDPIAFGNWDSVPAPAQEARPGQVLIHNHPSGELEPSDADVSIASAHGKFGVGFYIIDNACEYVRVVVKPFKEKPETQIDPGSLMDAFRPGGALAHGLSGYEFRPQQIEMLRLVARGFNENRIAVVEAGTGTGKSFAYLAPAIAWAVANKKRVVVSTNTINLQEQLLHKDVPELRDKLGWEFRAALVKGRSNYVSLRRLKIAAESGSLLQDARNTELRQLAAWAKSSPDGSRADLGFEVSDETWDAVMSDKDECFRARCPHFNDCFFYKSRREAASADLVVANHHLVMADAALKKDLSGGDFAAIMPPFERIVFDEAHHLEEVATSYFSTETSIFAIRLQLGKLQSQREDKGALSFLRQAVHRADSTALYPPTNQALRLLGNDLPLHRRAAEEAIEHFFHDLFYKTLAYFGIEQLGPRERRELRITEAVTRSPYWTEAGELLGGAVRELTGLIERLDKLQKLLAFYPDKVQKELADARMSLAASETKLTEHAVSMQFFLTADSEDYCKWFEAGYVREQPSIRPCTAPLDPAPHLRRALLARKKTIVMTSATLTVQGEFDFFSRQMGLASPEETDGAGERERGEPDGRGGAEGAPSGRGAADNPREAVERGSSLEDIAARTDFLKLGTPFDYARHCVVGVPLDTTSPLDPSFDLATAPLILETVRLTQGRAFVLFTSYRSLQRVHEALQRQLADEGMTVLRQGSMPRHKLLELFRSSPRAVLFATSSFWEGVDVQGRALECLVLSRLPFKVPTTPILEARSERIDRSGGDSFRQLTVPLAVIKFKQGFGRLIRSKSDRGIVLILDQRVATKYYGKIFLRSLPPVTIVQERAEEVLGAFRAFLES